MPTYYVSTTGNDTTGDGSEANPWASPGRAAGGIVTDDEVRILAGDYSIGGGTANTAGNRVDSSVRARWVGVPDGNGNPPRLVAAASSITLFRLSGASARAVSIEAYRDPAGGLTSVKGFQFSGTQCRGVGLRASYLNNMGVDLVGAGCVLLDSLVDGCSGSSGVIASSAFTANGCVVSGCVARNPGTIGIAASGYWRIDRCVVTGAGNHAFLVNTSSSATILAACVARGATTSGFSIASQSAIINCVAASCGGYGFDLNGSTFGHLMRACAVWNNTSGAINNPGTISSNEGFVTLTESPFVDAAGLDFSLNSAAGGGALLKGAGWPQSFPGLVGTSYPDIGAYQSQSGGGPVFYAY